MNRGPYLQLSHSPDGDQIEERNVLLQILDTSMFSRGNDRDETRSLQSFAFLLCWSFRSVVWHRSDDILSLFVDSRGYSSIDRRSDEVEFSR
jgi:hypothetical protein